MLSRYLPLQVATHTQTYAHSGTCTCTHFCVPAPDRRCWRSCAARRVRTWSLQHCTPRLQPTVYAPLIINKLSPSVRRTTSSAFLCLYVITPPHLQRAPLCAPTGMRVPCVPQLLLAVFMRGSAGLLIINQRLNKCLIMRKNGFSSRCSLGNLFGNGAKRPFFYLPLGRQLQPVSLQRHSYGCVAWLDQCVPFLFDIPLSHHRVRPSVVHHASVRGSELVQLHGGRLLLQRRIAELLVPHHLLLHLLQRQHPGMCHVAAQHASRRLALRTLYATACVRRAPSTCDATRHAGQCIHLT